MRWMLAVMISVVVLLSGCATFSQQSAAPLAAKVLGADTITYWVDAPGNPVSLAMLRAALASHTPSTLVSDLSGLIATSLKEPTRIAVAGRNSGLTAQVVELALADVPAAELPGLQLLFIGDRADAEAVRAAVEAKKARFVFQAAPAAR
ncbi:hypothetical protein [Paludibacterium yongneupense]|uniref:hypothetical protein n=1 Tax=Paludibacterium yongneupense TaxID=400061 RepID=UPI000428F0CE|nr:hypothetical protein [Paludibacterium yongneupense]